MQQHEVIGDVDTDADDYDEDVVSLLLAIGSEVCQVVI